MHETDMRQQPDDVRLSNRPFGVKHFQTIHQCGVIGEPEEIGALSLSGLLAQAEANEMGFVSLAFAPDQM